MGDKIQFHIPRSAPSPMSTMARSGNKWKKVHDRLQLPAIRGRPLLLNEAQLTRLRHKIFAKHRSNDILSPLSKLRSLSAPNLVWTSSRIPSTTSSPETQRSSPVRPSRSTSSELKLLATTFELILFTYSRPFRVPQLILWLTCMRWGTKNGLILQRKFILCQPIIPGIWYIILSREPENTLFS
jgi:hypothetical protein